MDEMISVCGSNCKECYCFKSKKCNGCNFHKGKVFHCSKDAGCEIYNCCVKDNNFYNCLKCEKLPCTIWNKTRDPKFSDVEFKKNIEDRINLLKNNK